MTKDIKKAKDIVIIVDDRKHNAEFLEKISNREIIFKMLERDHPYIKTRSGYRCQVLMTIGTEKYFLEGKIGSEFIGKAIIWESTPVMPDQRREIRYGTTPIITRLEAKKFLRTSIINGSINNISKSGAAIQTSVPLTKNHDYRLDTKFRIRRILKPFSAMFSVKYCNRMGEIYFNRYTSGGIFEKSSISPEYQKTLDEFIMSMEKI